MNTEWSRPGNHAPLLRAALGLATLSLAATTLSADTIVEAISGEPFGVAHVTISLDPTLDRSVVHTNGYRVESDSDRVFYPAITSRRVLGLLRDLVGTRDPGGTSAVTAWFLFKGNEPFDVTIRAPKPHTIRVVPHDQSLRHRRLLERWWRHYSNSAAAQRRNGDYSPVVETYLTSMLSNRLHLNSDRAVASRKSSLESDLLRLLFNTESLRIDAMRDTMLSRSSTGNELHPLPSGLLWPEDERVIDVPDSSIEQIARYVPNDWLYVRFGSFDNYLWLSNLAEQNGGDLSRMLTLRGHDALVSTKMQLQLGLRETTLSKLLGGQVVADMAVVGKDMYMREGAAIGVLFEAKNPLLMKELKKQRQIAIEQFGDADVKVETILINGVEVSLASSPDNRMRSFFASRDDFHLVTNCRVMVEQFLSDGKRLSDSPDFRRARLYNPANANGVKQPRETAFVFLSKAFLRNLLGPHYQVELRRRLNSVSEMELIQLAQLAASAEGYGIAPADHLSQLDLLPSNFGQRHDGSKLEFRGDKPFDSVRGARGFFLPIPDVVVSNVNSAELSTLQQIEQFQATRWNDMDAVSVFVRRESAGEGLERIAFAAKLDTFSPIKYGTVASVIGPPQPMRIVQPEQNVITAQVSLQGGDVLPSTGAHIVFLGMRDEPVEISLGRGRLQQTLAVLRTAPAYLGAWPRPGLLDLLPIGRIVVEEANAFERLPLGLWRWTSNEFSVVAFDQDALTKSVGDLSVEEREEAAQLHVHVGDLVNSKLNKWFRTLSYQRAFETSTGNTRFLSTLSQQLRVPPADARATAERILDIRLTCPLEGEYSTEKVHGATYWTSSAWSKPHGRMPDDFDTPLANWFRGLDVTGVVGENELELHGSLEIKRVNNSTKLPVFDFFRGGK
ncbi:MAG: hypothetical protein KDB27_11280 [Planctomycetales bacterium]|nr:hypothetical protein [Planctomycetales bacterium]